MNRPIWLVLFCGRKAAVADHVEVAMIILDARRALPARRGGLHQFQPPLETLIVEGPVPIAPSLLELEMAIIRALSRRGRGPCR